MTSHPVRIGSAVAVSRGAWSSRAHDERGMALLSAVMVMMLMSAVMAGFIAVVIGDQQSSGSTRDQTQAYAAAHAGLEKATSDLGDLFVSGNYSPTVAQLEAIEADVPELEGFVFEGPEGSPGYTVARGATRTAQVESGPYQGLVGLITPYAITVTARSIAGGEVRMRREMQTVGIPVFQFGIFSENDLAFFAGPNFNFGGRVHTNQHLFLKQDGGNTLTLSDRVTAVRDVVRTQLQNGNTGTHTSRVRVTLAPGTNQFRNLGTVGCGSTGPDRACEGSVLGGPGSARNPDWVGLSVGTYNRTITNGETGARRLDLPLVSDGARPIDLVRRPDRFQPDTPLVLDQRYFTLASIRVLISDTADDITELPTVTNTAPIPLGDYAAAVALGYDPTGTLPRFALSSGVLADGYRSAAGTPLLGGFIKIEQRTGPATTDWRDVTTEILNLGIAGRNLSSGQANVPSLAGLGCAEPNQDAVIRLQRVRDVPATAPPCGIGSTVATDYWPNVLYDAREGLRRDTEASGQTEVYLGGVMHYVELDVRNLKRWIEGAIGASGDDTWQRTGYVFYFSDRRGNRDLGADGQPRTADDRETGEYGWEDFINTDATSTPNGQLGPGEDMNGNGVLETYGANARPVNPIAPGGAAPALPSVNQLATWVQPIHRVPWNVARSNAPVFFRRALKLVNGQRGNLPFAPGTLQGLAVVSENPVYVQGNYNADGTGFVAHAPGAPDTHRSASILADAVTLLSNNWNDVRSFNNPHGIGTSWTGAHPLSGQRIHQGTTTWYRVGVIAGKGLAFPRAGVSPTTGDHADFGTDGGAHNFLRYLEDWSFNGATLNYRGSIVSFFTSRQGVGAYKCCDNVYTAPARGYNFDTEFLDPALLPPETPMFRDVNTLTFRQLLRPTQ
jgi:hypothetical protein